MKYIIGRKPVFEALKAGINLDQIIIAYGQHGDIINKIKSLAKEKSVKISQTSVQKFRDLEKGQNSQGVIAIQRDYKFYSLNEILESAKKSSPPLLLLLDSVQDTHNLGAILRTAECAGVDGVIITTYNSAPINETVEKTSAGSISHIKICQVSNLNNAMKELKTRGYWIIGSSLDSSKVYNDVDFNLPIALVVGNEEKGIRKLVADNCDMLVHIPMKGNIQSLNVSVASGILLFEILRQRKLLTK